MSNDVKTTFMGAGSAIFVRNVIGDCMVRESLRDGVFALYDIDEKRLKESEEILTAMNKGFNKGRAEIRTYLGVKNREAALAGANFVVNAIQVGGYKPSTVIDFEVPKKYGLRQTVADTLGIGGIFRALRTIPVLLDFARDMEKACPNAWFMNYANPMAMLTGAMLKATPIKTVGLCHSVQVGLSSLLGVLGLYDRNIHSSPEEIGYRCKIAGINHMAWLLSVTKNGKDAYPEIRKLAAKKVAEWRRETDPKKKSGDLIRLEMIRLFGYYVTESSQHNAEYAPYWIKSRYPELIDEYGIPLDSYMRTCERIIDRWKQEYETIRSENVTSWTPSREYAAGIIDAIVSDHPFEIGGNFMNKGLIPNLPDDAVVEVPCLVNGNGIQGAYVGALPPQCAAMNMTNVNVQQLAVEAALTRKKEHVYHAALLDPHTAAELSVDDIIAMCDDLFEAHGDMLPKYA